jgi:membrane protein implicated in regulation of membrane protease activity
MSQTILSVVLEVEPQSAGPLSVLIENLKGDEEAVRSPTSGELYGRLKEGVPSLHFLSMSVFHDPHYDPIFVIEANFDGPPGPFWAQMEATIGADLRLMLRCCKRPADSDGPLYDAVTKGAFEGGVSRYRLAAYFEARTPRPSVFHQGNRGLNRDRIEREGKLFLATRYELAQPNPNIPNPYRSMTAQQIHQNLRATLLTPFPWLGTSEPARISRAERVTDLGWLLGFVFLALVCLSIPGFVLAPITSTGRFFILFAVAIVVLSFLLWRMRAPLTGKGAPARSGGLDTDSLSSKNNITSLANPKGLAIWIVVFVAIYFVLASLIGSIIATLLANVSWSHVVWPTVRAVLLGLVSVIFSLLAIALWLRWLERRDSSQDAPPVNESMLREMARREDRTPQNHMGSVVLVKPGVLRMALFRAGHLGLGLLLRVVATDGYLGSMRTVHFAHWAFVNNGSRLMFFSNFDHSWDSYLDDFIEKAHGGLTLAWGSGVGFPPTRFLVLDGASHGRQFKNWARHSMAVSRFWFTAYKDYTVDQIERHVRIADGLRKIALTPKEADAWAKDL